MIHIAVNKAEIEIDDREVLTAGMANAVSCRFSFSSDWDDLHRIAVFTNGSTTVDVMLTGESCAVPHEVLTTPGKIVMVGVFGSDGESVVLPTVWGSLGVVSFGADPDGDESMDPALPVWQTVLDSMGNIQELKTADKSSLVAAVNELAEGSSAYSIRLTDGGNGDEYELYISNGKLMMRLYENVIETPAPLSISVEEE